MKSVMSRIRTDGSLVRQGRNSIYTEMGTYVNKDKTKDQEKKR